MKAAVPFVLVLAAIYFGRTDARTFHRSTSNPFVGAFIENPPGSKAHPSDLDIERVHTGHVTYRIPMAFIEFNVPSYPKLQFTYPGFQPSPNVCLDARPPSCHTVELVLANGYPLGTSSTPKQWKDHEQLVFKLFPPGTARLGHYYLFGKLKPGGGVIYIYSNYHGRKVIFSCYQGLLDKKNSLACVDRYFLSDGNSAVIFFSGALLNPSDPNKLEADIDGWMQRLAESGPANSRAVSRSTKATGRK